MPLKLSRFLAPSLATVLLSSAPILLAAPATSAPASVPSLSGWKVSAGEELESTWAWRARLKGAANAAGSLGEARVVFGALDGKGDAFLRVQVSGKRATFQFWRLQNGKPQAASAPASVALAGALDGELGLQASSSQVRALWDGRAVLEAWGLPLTGSIAASGKGLSLSGARLQPTEAIALSDDFMRASGPDEPEVDGSWHRASGVWKTSGLLGPRADAALNPNPFVFRAEAPAGAKAESQVLATVGSWFWSEYAITASVRPVLRDASAPLVVGLGAYMGDKEHARAGVSALVDVREGRAMIVSGGEVLATSAAFDFDPNTWHRLYFEPGPGTMRLFVDGVERARVDSATRRGKAQGDAAQGQAALVARLSGSNYADFDDVRAASSPSQSDTFRIAAPGRWADASGEWQTVAGTGGGRRVLRSQQGLTLTGAPEREEGSVEARFEVLPRAASASASTYEASQSTGVALSPIMGIAFAAQDAKNYFAARIRGANLEIVQFSEGQARLLGSAAMLPKSRPVAGGVLDDAEISVQWRDGIITARSYGAVANATVASIPAGRVGAVARSGAGSMVALASLQALGAAPAWGEGALPGRFEKEPLMENWASNALAWKKGAGDFFWHTGDFFGDSALTLPLPKLLTGSILAMRLNANPAKAQSGARLDVERREGGWKLSLSQDGKPLGVVNLTDAEWPASEQVDEAGEKVRSVRLVRRPLGENRVSLRAVAGGRTVFALEAAGGKDEEAIKCGVTLLGTPVDPNRPRGREVKVRVVTTERDKRAAVGIQLTELTSAFQSKLAPPDSKGAVVQGLEANSPAAGAGIEIQDVIQAVDGKKVNDVNEVINAIAGKAAGAAVELTLWRHLWDGPLNWAKIAATTTQTLDYTFTNAPVDWKASAGKWAVSERWTCSPQWAFFNGSNAANPTLWSRFGARGDWTLEAYIANPMDQTRGERSPSDLNLTVGGDGRDLSSGYSWIFGGAGRSVNRVYKGDAIALEKPFEQPALMGNTHQDWFYVRLEKRRTSAGVRFRYFVNGKMLMEYADPAPLKAALDGGRFAFWTYNGALSIARARLWYSNVETANVSSGRARSPIATLAASTSRPIANPIGAWAGRREDVLRTTALVASEKDGARSAVKITNAQSGGDWTAYVSRQPFDAAAKPALSFDYRVPNDVKVNLYVKVEDRWREIVFTGDVPSSTGKANAAAEGPAIVPGVAPGTTAEVDTSVRIGSFAEVRADGKWHRASFDLSGALRAANLGTKVQEIALAAPDQAYLRCGIGGNRLGATYWIANLSAGKAGAGVEAIAQAPRE